MRLKLSILAAVAALAAVATVMTVVPAAGASGSTDPNAVPMAGTTSTGGTFDGTLDIQNIGLQNGHPIANGTLTGAVQNAAGSTVGSVTDKAVSVPLAADPTGTCQILDLRIGAVQVGLLGLEVQLDPVHLNLSGQQGSGLLVGNLLCTVTHLLDNSNNSGLGSGFLGGLLQPIVNLLNQVLAGL